MKRGQEAWLDRFRINAMKKLSIAVPLLPVHALLVAHA